MGHVFKPKDANTMYGWQHCATCGQLSDHPLHIMTLAGMETADEDRVAALGISQAEAMAETLRMPLGDVSRKTGRMERDAPLFFGQGDNPLLF